MKHFHFCILLCVQFASTQSIDELGITVTGPGRQYVFTNKEAGTYYGEVNGKNSGGWQGWFVNAEKILHDYSVRINGKDLDRSTAVTHVLPFQIIRTYPNAIKETLTLTDSVNVLLIQISDPSAEINIHPVEGFQRNGSTWLRSTASHDFSVAALSLKQNKSRRSVQFSISADRTPDLAERNGAHVAAHTDSVIAKRKTRMQQILDRSYTTFNDVRITKALGWAKIQIDALIMNQATTGARTKGIFAGLPWFNNYWGRDSFISLPGATYVIGNFSDARDILISYAAFQEKDTTSSHYGRIPNLATPQSVIYNTADGTPWFVKSFYEYVKYSGDTSFVREVFPVLLRSIEGTIRHHADSLGFLVHADAESWMDAVGPNGPWSPRGNRSVEIQALWHQQLLVGVFCAEYLFDYVRASEWKNLADKLEKNFRAYFIDSTTSAVIDHLNADGSPSTEVRPNQLFAFDMAIPEDVRQTMVRTVLTELVYEHGTATLSRSDSNFHPYHQYPPYYVKDAAYHNGIIWTWLNGAVIDAATRYDLQHVVYPVTENSIHQILERGCVGTLAELLDVHVKNGEKESRLSGTYSQAWSLAEFIRSLYQDYLGISIDLPAKSIRINPKLPHHISFAEFHQQFGKGSLKIRYSITGDSVTTTIEPKNLSDDATVQYLYVYENGDAVHAPVGLTADRALTIVHSRSILSVFHGADRIVSENNSSKIFLRNFSDKKYFTGITLARPDTVRQYRVLQGPSHPLLAHTQVRRESKEASVLFSVTDPVGDDRGNSGVYLYPTSHHFKKGILDITAASFRYDSNYLYCTLKFANLYDPGWHPEYGFQLTFAAIAINTGNGAQRSVGFNSGYTLDAAASFDRMIVVGGGVRVVNEKGSILCEYIPGENDVQNPIGNVRNNTLEFTIPLEYLGVPNKGWKFSILIGGQDDHGGAGIGEFRTVYKEASEWLGGGKSAENESNIYDFLIIN